MMKEIRARGPIIGDFKVPLEFHYFFSGILTDDFSKAIEHKGKKIVNAKKISNQTMKDNKFAWEMVTHSVVIVGWGVEKGVKFWIVRNSYGPKWGEKGHFRVRRGTDDFAIESNPSAYVPNIISHHHKTVHRK